LRDNSERFAQRGVLIPRAGRGIDAAGHHNITQELLAGPRFCAERGGLRELGVELAASDTPRACISSEDFSLAARSPAALTRVRDTIAAAGYRPIIVIYLRPQISYAISVYAEIVKNGNLKPFRTFLREVNDHGSFLWNGLLGPLCRYDELLDQFAAVFGRAAIVVRRYPTSGRGRSLLRAFARLIVGARLDTRSFAFPHERFNRSLSFPRVLAKLGYPTGVCDMRFAPFTLPELLLFAGPFVPGNVRVLRRHGVWIPPFELRDVLLALPVRRSRDQTTSLRRARELLNGPIGPP
jgi:hypothetical protein